MTAFDIILSGMYFPNQFANIMLCANVTGVGTMIGLKSGKVIAYGTRTKRCAVCGAASRKGERPRSHDCRLNWSGSSKAMEPDIGNNLLKFYKIGPCRNILRHGCRSLQPLILLDPFRMQIYCS